MSGCIVYAPVVCAKCGSEPWSQRRFGHRDGMAYIEIGDYVCRCGAVRIPAPELKPAKGEG